MKKVSISDMKIENGKDLKRFSLRANGIPLAVTCSLTEFKEDNKKTLEKINNSLLNSIRFIKLYGDMPQHQKQKQRPRHSRRTWTRCLTYGQAQTQV